MKIHVVLFFWFLIINGSDLSAQNCDLSSTDGRRTQINSISNPYSFVVHLITHRKQSYNGTAFFIHPRVLLTAGHNLRKRPQFYFTRVKSITLRAGATSPTDYIAKETFITSQNENIYTLESFNKNYNIYEDFGIIILPDEKMFNEIGDHFQLVSYNPETMDNNDIYIAGYPGDKSFCTLWTDKTKNYFTYMNPIGNPNNLQYLKYDFTTYTGLSGSPVWFKQNGKNKVFAIHTYGNDNDNKNCNTATLITPAIYQDIVRFCKSKGVDITK